MKISFALDDTIIPGLKVFQTERQTFLQKLLKLELMRAGTVLLFKELKEQGHVVGIYTTSYRSRAKIKLLFLLNGFWLDFVINQEQNLRELKDRNVRSSKYPPPRF